jgi:hypothetical protein
MTAWRWLQAFPFHGIIEPAKKGTLGGRRATEWRFEAVR